MLSESGDSIELESYLIPESDLEEGQLRLLDCTPGRLNQTSALIEREGVFYGQCSEICGKPLFTPH
jgi:cytochrome c oxidase subunit 2